MSNGRYMPVMAIKVCLSDGLFVKTYANTSTNLRYDMKDSISRFN